MWLESAEHEMPVPMGWSIKSKLASLAQVKLFNVITGENIFLRDSGPTYRKLLNCEDMPGPPPRDTMVG